jgi:regulatory protein YycI of two-component signal transduction system YycFG
MAAHKTTLRGQRNQYLYTRDSEAITSQDYIMTSDNNNEDQAGVHLQISQQRFADATLTAMEAGKNNVDNTNKRGLTYNPITDQYGIRPDNYSSHRND